MPLWSGCQDEAYLDALETALGRAFASFQPDLVIHNAGTDILAGDPLGGCDLPLRSRHLRCMPFAYLNYAGF